MRDYFLCMHTLLVLPCGYIVIFSKLTCVSQPDPVLAQYLANYHQSDLNIQVSVTYL